MSTLCDTTPHRVEIQKLNFTFHKKKHTYGSRKQEENFKRRDIFQNETIKPVLSGHPRDPRWCPRNTGLL